jgi:hypothetical protein
MISTIRAIAKCCIVLATVTVVQSITPSYAADFTTYVSSSGTASSCTISSPCQDLPTAIQTALLHSGTSTARVVCLTPVYSPEFGANTSPDDNQTLEVNCPASSTTLILLDNSNMTVRLRGLTFTRSVEGTSEIEFSGSGTLILEDCAFVDVTTGVALDLEPTGPLHLVIKNCRISNNPSGMLLKPAAGGSINATLDHVTITNNNGGGIKIDTTNGPVVLDISDSVVSNNAGNGINAVSGAGQGMISIEHSVIAKNSAAGIQANGPAAGVLVSNTTLDENTGGALSVVNGGHISTYGDNRIVGTQGANFTGTAALK